MVRYILSLILALGVCLILVPVVDAKDDGDNAYSHLFLFRVLDGATWQPEEIPLTKGKSMHSLCVPVSISSQPLGSGKVCLSGQDKQTEAVSLWDLWVYINLPMEGTLDFRIPKTTVLNLTKSMATQPRSSPFVISGASRKDTNPVLRGTGKFRGAQGVVDVFGVLDTKAIDVRESVAKYPFLGDIPVLGALFRSTELKK